MRERKEEGELVKYSETAHAKDGQILEHEQNHEEELAYAQREALFSMLDVLVILLLSSRDQTVVERYLLKHPSEVELLVPEALLLAHAKGYQRLLSGEGEQLLALLRTARPSIRNELAET